VQEVQAAGDVLLRQTGRDFKWEELIRDGALFPDVLTAGTANGHHLASNKLEKPALRPCQLNRGSRTGCL